MGGKALYFTEGSCSIGMVDDFLYGDEADAKQRHRNLDSQRRDKEVEKSERLMK